MIEPGDRVLHCLDRRCSRRGRPAQQNDVDAERPGCCDFAVGRAAAAVLGDDDIDFVGGHQRAIVGFAERATRVDVSDMRQRQRRIDRIDAAHQITVLRRGGERRQLVAAERDKDAARLFADGAPPPRAVSFTSIQRSPATAVQGGRRSAMKGTEVRRAAAAAFSEMILA